MPTITSTLDLLLLLLLCLRNVRFSLKKKTDVFLGGGIKIGVSHDLEEWGSLASECMIDIV